MEHHEAVRTMAAERYLLEELSDDERDAFEAHFFECAVCADSVRTGKLIAATGAGRIAFVDVRDVAAAAAAVLADPHTHDGKIHTLTGPRALSFSELAALLSDITGHRVCHISPPRWLARIVLPWVSGMPRWQSNLVVDLMAALAAGAQSTPTPAIAETSSTGSAPGARLIRTGASRPRTNPAGVSSSSSRPSSMIATRSHSTSASSM